LNIDNQDTAEGQAAQDVNNFEALILGNRIGMCHLAKSALPGFDCFAKYNKFSCQSVFVILGFLQLTGITSPIRRPVLFGSLRFTELLVGTVSTAQAEKAVSEDAAFQKSIKLRFDKLGQAGGSSPDFVDTVVPQTAIVS
jgi:hypothetical protein